ncbi:phage head morphogenesis protein [Streptomyces sp. LS1784]|uniref:phage head morphogenesis protein n=1 Tax=Streptomyces sp. LS1784 TaxID=2851533 RepID=UPI001CCE22D6|nr:phage head morphogenesis protein [Streptomyces sp. LS1784]
MAHLELPSDIARRLAPLMLRHTQRLAWEVEEEARRRAPAAKTWHTQEDGRARPSHQAADGQTVPAPLPFSVGNTTLSGPRDPDGPVEETAGCRCTVTEDPEAVAATISAGKAAIDGTRTRAEVVCDFPRAAEAEFAHGDGTHFMSGAASQVAARHR